MKLSPILLAGSLAANAALVAALLLRPAAPVPSAPRPPPVANARAASAEAAQAAAKQHEALLAALAAGDSATLLAAGVAPEAVRLLAAARAFGRLAALAREQDDAPAGNTTEYWRRARATSRPPPTREQRAARLAAERWGTFSRANDGEYQRLTGLAARLNLPAATADQIYAVRDSYSAQSLAINQNAALSSTERRAQLTDLANRAKDHLRQQLGADGADAYGRQAAWLQMLQNGTAFTTNARLLPPGSGRPGGGATAFGVPPPRSSVAGTLLGVHIL